MKYIKCIATLAQPSHTSLACDQNVVVGWTRVLSKGAAYGATDLGAASTNTIFAISPNRIFRRLCINCASTHKVIFYKRISDTPPGFSIYDHMASNWLSGNNLLGADFGLYNNYGDALAGVNTWQYCNYDNATVGFPRECGPLANGAVEAQWNSFQQLGGQSAVAFDVDMSTRKLATV